MPRRTSIRSVVAATAVAALVAGLAGPATAAQPEAPVAHSPFLGARGYVDPDWSARAAAAADDGGDLAPAMSLAARQPTAVWLDSTAAIAGHGDRRGLREHLDAALAQQRGAGQPVVVTVVLYNLPNRSCARGIGGDFASTDAGLAAYRTDFVDPIAAILADLAYRTLRIAVVVEPDALGNQVHPFPYAQACEEFQRAGVYLDSIPYALAALHELPNVYAYLDITGSNQLGWDEPFAEAVTTIGAVARRTPGGIASVDGFAVNVGDYVPLEEPFLDISATRFGADVLQSSFVDWNDHLEERTFIEAMHAALVTEGFPRWLGMLVDTSRNGWGGPARPTAPSASTNVETFVDESRVDRRPTRSTWCNQVGAGLGALPRAVPVTHVDAYVWVKPPGESDGHHSGPPTDTANAQCDPTADMPPFGASHDPTNAMPGAPPRGEWFPAAFTELVRNAHPAPA